MPFSLRSCCSSCCPALVSNTNEDEELLIPGGGATLSELPEDAINQRASQLLQNGGNDGSVTQMCPGNAPGQGRNGSDHPGASRGAPSSNNPNLKTGSCNGSISSENRGEELTSDETDEDESSENFEMQNDMFNKFSGELLNVKASQSMLYRHFVKNNKEYKKFLENKEFVVSEDILRNADRSRVDFATSSKNSSTSKSGSSSSAASGSASNSKSGQELAQNEPAAGNDSQTQSQSYSQESEARTIGSKNNNNNITITNNNNTNTTNNNTNYHNNSLPSSENTKTNLDKNQCPTVSKSSNSSSNLKCVDVQQQSIDSTVAGVSSTTVKNTTAGAEAALAAPMPSGPSSSDHDNTQIDKSAKNLASETGRDRDHLAQNLYFPGRLQDDDLSKEPQYLEDLINIL